MTSLYCSPHTHTHTHTHTHHCVCVESFRPSCSLLLYRDELIGRLLMRRTPTTKRQLVHTHTHTHTHIYIYIYIFFFFFLQLNNISALLLMTM